MNYPVSILQCFPYSMMGENAAPYAAPNAAALSPSSVLCLFPNVDMFSAMGQQAANEAAKQEEQRPQQEVLRSLRSQGRMESSQVFISEAFHLRSGRRGINLSHSFPVLQGTLRNPRLVASATYFVLSSLFRSLTNEVRKTSSDYFYRL